MFGMNAVGGYGMGGFGYGMGGLSAMPNYAQLNDMKLLTSVSAGSKGFSSAGSVKSGNWGQIDSGTSDFLKTYQNDMTELLSSANALRSENQKGISQEMGVSSSDNKVLSASARFRNTQAASYTVNVQQLAGAQSNVSQSFESSAESTLSGTLSIAGPKRGLDIDLADIAGRTNEEKMRNLAAEINGRGIGVSARVVQDGGNSYLELNGDKTGAGNSFQVSGSFADQSGLGKVAQASQDAVYTVKETGSQSSGTQFTSATNKDVTIGNYKISADLKAVGEAQINVGRDNSKTANALDSLIKSYNKTVSFLSANASSRGSGVSQTLNRLSSPISEKSMKLLGITQNKDGTLNFNKDTFMKAADSDSSLVDDLVSGSNGLASRIYQSAKSGLNVSSRRLTGENPAGSRYSGASFLQMQTQRYADPLNIMGTYSRTGVINAMSNSSAGLLMNINI